ncbi:MAG: hypothetical protein KDD54_02550 [Flavobacteriales bacterium]|nr:hypothetical protein [Flavobacteriales bacterium]
MKHTYDILKEGGKFRCIVPDLEYAAKKYLSDLENNVEEASIEFIGKNTLVGIEDRPQGLKGILTTVFGNSHHLWMWDHKSLAKELENIGFKNIRPCKFNDSQDNMFSHVEDPGRFENAVALECEK